MKRNRTLQKMLEDYRPDLGDSNEYMEQLQRRLETVEAVKQLYETERRRTRSLCLGRSDRRDSGSLFPAAPHPHCQPRCPTRLEDVWLDAGTLRLTGSHPYCRHPGCMRRCSSNTDLWHSQERLFNMSMDMCRCMNMLVALAQQSVTFFYTGCKKSCFIASI